MGQLIDLCGMPIELNKIKSFRLIKRDYIFYPAYQEVMEQNPPLLAKLLTAKKSRFVFLRMLPYGALLNQKEEPIGNSYEIKGFENPENQPTRSNRRRFFLFQSNHSFSKSAEPKQFALFGRKKRKKASAATTKAAMRNVASVAADMLHIDTSINQEFRIITHGHQLRTVKLKDIPTKIHFLSGKVSDVYKHDANYKLLGESTTPTIAAISSLVVTIGHSSYVFFGGGIDLDNAEDAYYTLLEAYNNHHFKTRKNISPLKSQFRLPHREFFYTEPDAATSSHISPDIKPVAISDQSVMKNKP